MTRDQLEELLALDSLGLLEPEERRALEAAIAADPSLRTEADALRATAELLPFAAELRTPSPEMKHRILREVDSRNASEQPARKASGFPWTIAAMLAILAGGFGWNARNARLERDEAKRLAIEEEAALRDLRIATLQPTTPGSPATGAIAWNQKNGTGMLVANRLPTLAPDRCYQIWIVDPKRKDPVNGGIFVVGPDGSAQTEVKADQPVSAADQFVISLEKAGGVPKAEGPFVMAGK